MRLNELYYHIKEFHLKHGVEVEVPLDGSQVPKEVIEAREFMDQISKHLLDVYDHTGAPIALRSHLILEELCEMMKAVESDDRLGFIDAIGDLQYVVTGTAVTYGAQDMDGILTEIHSSNMTKEATGDPRVRLKGQDYRPPDLSHFE